MSGSTVRFLALQRLGDLGRADGAVQVALLVGVGLDGDAGHALDLLGQDLQVGDRGLAGLLDADLVALQQPQVVLASGRWPGRAAAGSCGRSRACTSTTSPCLPRCGTSSVSTSCMPPCGPLRIWLRRLRRHGLAIGLRSASSPWSHLPVLGRDRSAVRTGCRLRSPPGGGRGSLGLVVVVAVAAVLAGAGSRPAAVPGAPRPASGRRPRRRPACGSRNWKLSTTTLQLRTASGRRSCRPLVQPQVAFDEDLVALARGTARRGRPACRSRRG